MLKVVGKQYNCRELLNGEKKCWAGFIAIGRSLYTASGEDVPMEMEPTGKRTAEIEFYPLRIFLKLKLICFVFLMGGGSHDCQ